MVLHNNYRYWWVEDNKKSTRYTCIERAIKKCSDSLTVAGDKVIRSTGHCGHSCLSDDQVKILVKGQELNLI